MTRPGRPVTGAPASTAAAGPPAVAAPRTRFAQLTYSSFDRGDGSAGGWQVKDTRGGITLAEQRFLVSGIATALDDGRRIAAIPTAPELEALPRRLVYAPGPDGTAAYWHTAVAGPDSSGRPGNVFAHVLLDREPSLPTPPLRPSDLVFSPRWLRPFGSQSVLATSLDAVPPPPWPDVVLGRPEVVAFLVEEATWRPGVLAALLDAVHAAMAVPAGPPVVLAVAEPARGSYWIAAVSHLMSPGTSRRLFWSSLERAAGLARLRDKRIALAVLPASELDAVESVDGLVVIVDGEESVELGDLHGLPHRTRPHDCPIRVTPWSVVAALAVQEPGLAERVLEQKDRIAAEAGDRNLPCGWPLAVAVLEHADELGDAQREANQLITTEGRDVPMPPAVQRRMRSLQVGPWGRTAELALAEVEAIEAGRSSVTRELGVNVYARLALDDRDWLLAREPGRSRPVIAPESLDPELVDRACAVLDALTAEAGSAPDRTAPAAAALRVIDFALGIGLDAVPEGQSRSLTDAVLRALNDLVGPLLLDPVQGPSLVALAGAVLEPAQKVYVRPWVDWVLGGPGVPPLGRRLTPDVLAWLFPEPPEPSVPAYADTGISPTLAELAVQLTRIVPDPSAFRALAAWVALDPPGKDTRRQLTRLSGGPVFTSADLQALVAAYGPLLVAPLLLPSLLAVADDEALRDTVGRLRGGSLDPFATEDGTVRAVLAAAELRYRAAGWPRGTARDLLDTAASVLARPRRLPLAADVTDVLIAARVVELVGGAASTPDRSALSRWLAEEAAPGGLVSARVAGHVVAAVRAGAVAEVDVAVAAQLTSGQSEADRAGRPAWADAAPLRVAAAERPESLLDHVVRWTLARRSPDDIADLVRRTRHAVAGHLRKPEPDHRYDAFAARWWRNLGTAEPVGTASSHREWFA